MSAANDRRLPGSGKLIAAAVVLVILASAAIVLWRKAPDHHAVSGPAAPQGLPATAGPVDVPVSMTVYMPAEDALTASPAQVKRKSDAQSQARELSLALLSDDRQGKGPVLANVKLRELFLDASGTAYVDLTIASKEGIHSSTWDELLSVYALVNTLTQNVEEIKGVRFLVDGKEAQTLAGHIDLSRTFTKRMDLVRE